MLLPGMDVRIVNDEGKELPKGEMGNIVIAKPLPPSALSTVWGNPKRFHEAYYERFEKLGGWFDTGDAGIINEEGYISVLSRADDLIK
jgi:propionyl-CoA synthetase